ncbi:MAG: ComEC/Rec2 family competence protein [Luteolibacter sp.]
MSSLKLTFLDVQHGSACHIETPTGQNIMFDLGTGDFDESQGGTSHSPLLYLYNTKNIHKLDSVIITHPHADHISDINNFDLLSPTSLHCPRHLTADFIKGENQSRDQSKVSKYLEIVERYSGSFETGQSPLQAPNHGCNQFDLFSCNPDSDNLNDHSTAAVISFAGTKFLLTGDTEKAGWEKLLSMPRFRQAATNIDILLASHHGRDNGFNEDLFELIGRPAIVIISDTAVGTTSVTNKYYNKTNDTGWNVRNRSNGDSERRYCLTTRGDGTIEVICSKDAEGKTFRTITRK